MQLIFEAPPTDNPVTYYHWFHYITSDIDDSDENCRHITVTAHNEKWTTVSTGGVHQITKSITISTPSGTEHVVCAAGLAFITSSTEL